MGSADNLKLTSVFFFAEISSGTNAPPLSAMTEKPDHGEESDDVNGGHEEDVDASGGEDEDASKELTDEGLIGK